MVRSRRRKMQGIAVTCLRQRSQSSHLNLSQRLREWTRSEAVRVVTVPPLRLFFLPLPTPSTCPIVHHHPSASSISSSSPHIALSPLLACGIWRILLSRVPCSIMAVYIIRLVFLSRKWTCGNMSPDANILLIPCQPRNLSLVCLSLLNPAEILH